MSNDRYFQDAALTLLGILTCNRKNPVNQKTRELSFGEMGLLHCLSQQEDAVTAGELRRMIGIGAGGVTNLLNSLEKKGYVQRMMSPADRRSVLVLISAAGKELVEEKQNLILSFYTELLSRMGHDDTEEFLRILKRMNGIGEELYREMLQGKTACLSCTERGGQK